MLKKTKGFTSIITGIILIIVGFIACFSCSGPLVTLLGVLGLSAGFFIGYNIYVIVVGMILIAVGLFLIWRGKK